MKRKFEKGFTLIELFVVLWFLVRGAALFGLGYALIHFISKFW